MDREICCGRIVALRCLTVLLLLGATATGTAEEKRVIRFSGYNWVVKDKMQMGPGPNRWRAQNVFVDAHGCLHLRLSKDGGSWTSAELTTTDRFGFGRYQFVVEGPLDRLDKNVVLGLFNYATPDVGPNGTNEIDIEFSRFGSLTNPIGTYSIAPAVAHASVLSRNFAVQLRSHVSSHSFTWRPTSVLFMSRQGEQVSDAHCDDPNLIATALYQPRNAMASIPQQPMPVHINLWSFRGLPPSDGKEVEIVIRTFQFQRLTDPDNHNPFHRIGSLCALRLLTESRLPHTQYFGLITRELP